MEEISEKKYKRKNESISIERKAANKSNLSKTESKESSLI